MTVAVMPKPLVAYFRVSTRGQGRSGLGIDAQRAAVARFAAAAEDYDIVADFVEIETSIGKMRRTIRCCSEFRGAPFPLRCPPRQPARKRHAWSF